MGVYIRGITMIEQIEKLFNDYAKNENFSGVALIKQGENILFEYEYGYAHKGFKIPNTTSTMFDTASITKTFTATAILMLVKENKLKLEDKIHELINLEGTSIPKDVRVIHLLTHTSGIADDADEENGEDYSALFIQSPNYAIRNHIDFIPNFAYKEPNFKAGTNVRYNNCAFVLLGLVIEKITGQSYRKYVTEHIFEAFNMKDTKFCAMDEVNEHVAEGYYKSIDEDGNTIFKKNIYSYPPIGTADGGAYTTVHDLDKFMRQLKNEIDLQALFEPHCEFVRNYSWDKVQDGVIRFGYAFEFVELGGKIFSMYKEGANAGVANMFAYYPQYDMTFTILANHDCNVWSLHRKVQEIIYDCYK